MSNSSDWRMEYGVQPFVEGRRRLDAEPIRLVAGGKEAAVRLGERLAPSKAGVLVFCRRFSAGLGEYDTPTVIARHGRIPPEVLEQLAA